MNNYWLSTTDHIFDDMRLNTLDPHDKHKRRIFIDRGSDVLLVAHLDTVLPPKLIKETKGRIYARGLDDRIGCEIAYSLSEQLGADLLLTDLEESCRSTAEFHDCKDYNWIAEFDRAGGDVVTYGLDNSDFKAALSEHWIIGIGSFSDISVLKTTACCVNIGVGYHHAHSKDSYLNKRVMQEQVAEFKQFYEENKHIAYRHERQPDEYWSRDPFELEVCEVCGIDYGQLVYDYIVCESCFSNMLYDKIAV